MEDEERGGGFLPPEPAGPEPELGGRSAPRPPAPVYQAPQAQPPPPGSSYPPAAPGWQPAPQPWAYPQPPAPENNQAIAGFVLSLVSLGLLVVSLGLSSVISLGCAIAGMVFGRKGVNRVDAGETPKHRGLGQAGFWIGLAGLILSLIATAAWVAVLVAALTDDEFRNDLEREFDGSQSISAAVVAALRSALHLLAWSWIHRP
jgi:hypothetical protein